ncbi:MAG: AAA family ATPase [Pseudomonadota bacterium]
MYTRFFGLHQQPFSIAPDPRYLFMSQRHREALAHLLYGLDGGGGFVLLTGEVGAGKTTVCRLFLEQIPATCNVAYIFNPKQTAVELLQSICDEFGIVVSGDNVASTDATTAKKYVDALNVFLLRSHASQQNNILIIDEAQNLSLDVLEQLRLLTNLETNERKLLQIVLIGQPELRMMLARPELEQLAQRIIARFHLEALSAKETAQYIAHRLMVAGGARSRPFSASIMRRIHRLAAGIPRRINLLSDRALLGAYARGKQQVDAKILTLAAHEIFGPERLRRSGSRFWYGIAAWSLLGFGSVAAVMVSMPVTLSFINFPSLNFPLTNTAQIRSEMTTELSTAGSTLDSMGTETQTRPSQNSLPVVSPSPPPLSPLPVTIASDVRDLQNAFRQLGKFWSLQLGDGGSCSAAQRQDTYCYIGKNGLTEIRQLNRPGILTLYDDQGQKYYAVLTGLSSSTATIQLGARSETVALDTLATRWRGGFTTLWRGPPGYAPVSAKAARGATSVWIASRLAKVGLLPPSEAVADRILDVRLRQFQVAQGLTPDGVARPQTLMRLAAAAGDAEPTLQTGDDIATNLSAMPAMPAITQATPFRK